MFSESLSLSFTLLTAGGGRHFRLDMRKRTKKVFFFFYFTVSQIREKEAQLLRDAGITITTYP